jgi:DNA end-binding protein Ku
VPDTSTEGQVRARPFWSGTITFGLVSIPVNLFSATRAERVALRMVDEDGTLLARRYFCPEEEKALEWDDLVRGFEIAPDEYVVVTDDELEALEPRKSRDIDLRRFVPADQLDPKFFERGYYLTPAGESTKAYQLLAAIMEKSNRAGIATFVMRGKEYLIAILAEHGILRAETLRFADEIRTVDEVGLPDKPRLQAADVAKMETAIKKRVSAEFAPRELQDRYAQRLLKLVKQKKKRTEDVVEAPAEAEEEAEAEVIDLMEVLRQSLRSKTGARKTARKTARKAPRKTTRKRKAA